MAFLGMQRPSAGAPRRRDGGNLPALASQAQWLAFMLFFGVLQASYFAAVRLEWISPDAVHEVGPDQTIVILDGSRLEGAESNVDEAALQGMLQNPAAVMTFDGSGNRKLNDFDRDQIAQRDHAPRMADGADEAAVDAPVRPASVTRASRVATPARRPSYVWAQNVTHAFVTVSLTPEERSGAATPRVAFSAKVVHVSVPAEAADESAQSPPDAVALRLEIYRAVQPAACSWQRTSRGIMIRLRKQARGHWPRLLRAEGHDGKQGVDWARWSHPEADRAEKRDANSDEFHRRNAARHKDIERLRPRFDGMLQEFAAARERDEYLEPQQQVEMLRLGEAILSHYRTERKERTSLLGDAPLPAGVDEEALERALIKLRELERGGELDYNRNTPSWKEFNRRQKLRRAKKRKQLKKQKKRRIGTQLVAVQPVA